MFDVFQYLCECLNIIKGWLLTHQISRELLDALQASKAAEQPLLIIDLPMKDGGFPYRWYTMVFTT